MRLAATCILAEFIACFQSAAAIEIPDTATVLPGYASRIDAMRRILDGTTDNLTGLWNYPEEQMVVAIRKSSEFNYQLIAVEAENEAIDCGTVIGYLTTTANKSKMRMWLYSVVDGDRLTSPVENAHIRKPDAFSAIGVRRSESLPSNPIDRNNARSPQN